MQLINMTGGGGDQNSTDYWYIYGNETYGEGNMYNSSVIESDGTDSNPDVNHIHVQKNYIHYILGSSDATGFAFKAAYDVYIIENEFSSVQSHPIHLDNNTYNAYIKGNHIFS